MKNLYFLTAISTLTCVFFGCGGSVEEQLKSKYPISTLPAPTDATVLALTAGAADEASIAAANNKFTLALLKKLTATTPQENVFCSPFNVAAAFGQLYLGASGSTETEISQVFGWQSNSEAHHQAMADLYKKLTTGGEKDAPVLKIANKFWVNKGFSTYAAYGERLKKYYATELLALDFGNSAEAAKNINTWVAEKTNNKIKEVFAPDAFKPSTQFVIASALYFQANWQTPFDAANTTDAPFKSPKASKSVPMMKETFKYSLRYFEGANWQAVALPYKNGSLEMYVILPKDSIDIQLFMQNLSDTTLAALINEKGLDFDEVKISLPRWKAEYTTELLAPLSDMGMAASLKALDLARLTDAKDLAVGAVIHKTFVEVNERGTEAAAVTAISVKSTSAAPREKVIYYFEANRPFVYFIADQKTKTLLFAGQLTQP